MKKSFIAEYIGRMLPAIILGQMVMTICTTIDAIITTQFLGNNAVAGEGLVTPVTLIIIAVAGIMSAGNATICSNESGKGNVDEMNRVFSTTLTVSLVFSIVCTVLVLLFANQICAGLGPAEGTELFRMTRDYMTGYVPLMPILAVVTTLPAMLQIEGDNKTNILVVVLVFVLDIAFDLLNVLVIHGGVLGMALATTFSYYIAGAVMLFRFFGKKRVIRFSLKYVELRRVGRIMSYGTPAFVNALCLGLTSAALNGAFLKYGSELYVAAFTIVSKIGDVLLCVCYGSEEMTSMVTGIANGEEDRNELKEILRIMCRHSVVVNLILTAATWICGSLLVRVFTGDTAMIGLATFGLRIFALQFVFRTLLMCYVGYLRGIKRFMAGNILLAVMAASAAAFAWAAPLAFGVSAVWYSYFISTVFSLLYLLLFVGFTVKASPFSWDSLILQPASYGIQEENYLEKSIHDIPELCSFSEDVADFAVSHDGSSQQAYLLSLFTEEMGKNVLTWAFCDEKEHRFMIKVMKNSEDFILRFRDDGKQFDPTEYYRIQESKKPYDNFGIHLVMETAKDVTYINTMNLNNLLVKM